MSNRKYGRNPKQNEEQLESIINEALRKKQDTIKTKLSSMFYSYNTIPNHQGNERGRYLANPGGMTQLYSREILSIVFA